MDVCDSANYDLCIFQSLELILDELKLALRIIYLKWDLIVLIFKAELSRKLRSFAKMIIYI